MNRNVGFIGTGNMGGALARAAARSIARENIILNNRSPEKAQALARELGCTVGTAGEIAGSCGLIFLGVKPHLMQELLRSLAPALAARTDEFVLVSMAAGLTRDDIRRMAGAYYPVIRIMPNTPVAVGSGVVLFDTTENVSPEAMAAFRECLGGAGLLDYLPEPLMDAGTALAGCGPAFACLILEALADGAVLCGLPREKARLYAAKMLQGAASLALEAPTHTAALKDAVCSPGGSTIAGLQLLEQRALRSALMDAVAACYEKTGKLR